MTLRLPASGLSGAPPGKLPQFSRTSLGSGGVLALVAVPILLVGGAGAVSFGAGGSAGLDPVLLGLCGIAGSAVAVLAAAQRQLVRLQQRTLWQDDLLQRFDLAVSGSNAGIWHWDAGADRVQLSARAEFILGLPTETAAPLSALLARVDAPDRPRLEAGLLSVASGGATHYEGEFLLPAEDGSHRWISLRAAARRDAHNAACVGGSVTDVSSWKQFENDFEHVASHDALTGIPNVAHFQGRIHRAVETARRRPGSLFAVLLLDLDGFKLVNDALGHPSGDALLVAVALRLRVCLRGGEVLARVGGDEFALLIEGLTTHEQATQIAQRLRGALSDPFIVADTPLRVTASVGIARGSSDTRVVESLLRDAEAAMYEAKSEGRDRQCVFTPGMREGVLLRMQVRSDLDRALVNGEFELHYQPIVNLASGRMCGLEALLRWPTADPRFCSPAAFIPAAEETGQIVPLTAWVLEEACRTLSHWRRNVPGWQDLWVHVNISARQFGDEALTAEILAMLALYDLPPAALHLEITETAMLARGPHVEQCIEALRAAGLEIHLDDFGTGYSSLSYLHRYRLQGLKIDRCFIGPLDGSGVSGIVNAILDIARSLDMGVVAEGVETSTQMTRLRDMGCEMAQGFYFSPALPPTELETILREGAPWAAVEAVEA